MIDGVSRTTVAELKRVHAEGRAAPVGTSNPYRGRIVLAAVWMGGYRRMLDDMLAKSPARQAFLRRQPSTTENCCARTVFDIRLRHNFTESAGPGWIPRNLRSPERELSHTSRFRPRPGAQ